MPSSTKPGNNGNDFFQAPRMTEYLRNISLNAFPTDPCVVNLPFKPWKTILDHRIGLSEHRKSRINRSLSRKKKWSSVTQFILDRLHISKRQSAEDECNRFLNLAKDFSRLTEVPCGTEGKVDETALLLLHLFLHDYDPLKLTKTTVPNIKQVSSLKEYFGSIEPGLLSRATHLFNSLMFWIDPETQKSLEKKVNLWRSGKSSSSDEEDDSQMFPFRAKLRRLEPGDVSKEQDGIFATELLSLHSISSHHKRKEQTEDEKVFALFAAAEAEAQQPEEKTPAPSIPSSSKVETWDRNYLLNLIGNEDIMEALIHTINSTKTNDEIQDQLFDLLGFEKLDVITKVLANRTTLMKNLIKQEALAMAARNQVNSANSSSAHPVIGVRIQSAEEKYLEKIYRKEDKKAMKSGNSLSAAYNVQPEMDSGNQKNTNLVSNRGFNGSGTDAPNFEYPNVYDSYAAAKAKAGYISGTKVVLPDNMTRKVTQDCEEVEIPPEIKTVPHNAAKKPLIKISDLDPTAREVFRGMETLNRIQTLVFDTAYKTNENLLICAPTGAGKTNIALLTVIHCILNNITSGVIEKNKFKIVYVAPMKALAAEMTASFGKRLAPLGISVRELTGDMQLTKAEITQTQMLVTTPEKWDVVTRKSTGDVALTQIVQLLIIDEVHLLHGDRGPVVESLVARTIRQVETSQNMIRIVGLSATLPNYRDVALFLRVNPRVGLFYFDSRFRPVPLGQTFIGVKGIGMLDQQRQMDQCCYDKAYQMVSKGHQVMIFVHARNATVKTAEIMIEIAAKKGQAETFMVKSNDEAFSAYGKGMKSLEKSKNRKLGELFQYGFSCHHAGLLRSDRTLVEKLFSEGLIRVLVCTATLAWGVNLPAHAVIIKGTEIYDSKQGTFVDLGILDVLQIFGRAGRPQFDKEGHGTIITTHDKLAHYLSLLTNQIPIESNFVKFLADNLNAEVALGSVSNINEAVEWLTYTYLYVRMRRNPQLYGMQYMEAQDDPQLTVRRKELIVECAKNLETARMIRFDERTEYLYSTDLGRTASHFYIKYDTIERFNEIVMPVMAMDGILMMICRATEFEQLKVRDEEMDELDDLSREYCWLKVWGGSENVHGKVSILIQTYISRGFVKSFSLMSDLQYVTQNAVRICRGFFEVVLRQGNPLLAGRLLEFSKMLDNQQWDFNHPLRQHKHLSQEVLEKIEKAKLSMDTLRASADEIGDWIKFQKMGAVVKRCAEEFPQLDLEVSIQPITRNVLRVRILLLPNFRWNDRLHGNVSESFWIWVEDSENNCMYHQEYFIITKRQVMKQEQQELVFTIPITEPLPTQYYVRVTSDHFLGCTQTMPVSFKHLILPERHPPHTVLLDLDPLPTSALRDTRFELLYPFQFFNPIQTQIFHCLYHTDSNALVGAPTGSGKTIAAEMAMFRVFKVYPATKVVYIAPMKALVRERMIDWKKRLEGKLGKKVVELTGDVTPDVRAIGEADVIVTTPEKWDGISRSWQTRTYVQAVSLIIIDEIHLLGEDRGPVLEVIVSRTNFISQHTKRNLRVIGLSTALANARDLADWLGIKGFQGLFNFRPSVRPVPIQVHIQGFPGKHYCPRMATMNKPTFQAIREHSPSKPALVFVSSRRQTRLTALDLIAHLAGESNPKQWLKLDEDEMDELIYSEIKEPNLKLTLSFGIGIHHAGLQESDRRIVEQLFVNQKIQVLIATATLAWGVNFPAHLVVIKGTEYFDGKTHRYVDMPITDVLQMMGRAGRPQFDVEGIAVVLVHDQKKNFYKKFLYEPFPVESSLLDVLPDHLNAEIVAGTITSNQEAMNYLTCTYFFRRLVQNPSYYHLESSEVQNINQYLSNLIAKACQVLENASCIYIHEDLRTVEPTSFGRIAGYYYLSHQTMQHFTTNLGPTVSLEDLLVVMTEVHEYSQLPVRHNEDLLNEQLSKDCPIEVTPGTYNSPHTKAHLLLQCHFSRLQLPCSDYYTDLKSVLDQALRILQAMIDACAENGWLGPTLNCINLIQMLVQARWLDDPVFLALPGVDDRTCTALIKAFQVDTLPELQEKTKSNSELLDKTLALYLPREERNKIEFIYKTLQELPVISLKVEAQFDNSKVHVPYTSGPNRAWIDLPTRKDITLVIHMNRENSFPKDLKVFAPKFTKSKDEAWFLVLGDIEKREVVALKRGGGIKRNSQQQLKLSTPDSPGRVIYNLYVMCDSYLGVDMQYEICLNYISDPESKKDLY